MTDSIQVASSASAGVSKSKMSAIDSGRTSSENEGSSSFGAALASYDDAPKDVAQNEASVDAAETPNELAENALMTDGKALPAEELAILWQALMLNQAAESPTVPLKTNLPVSTAMAAPTLLANQKLTPSLNTKPELTSPLLSQDYFTTMALQSEQSASGLPSAGSHNINMQLAAAHFTPERGEAIMINLSDQLSPSQSNNMSPTQGIAAASLAAVGLGTATQAAVTQTQMVPLNMSHSAWESNLSTRLQMMLGQNVQTAEIRLDPPELGALDIKIKVTNDVAHVSIVSANNNVREALESAVPKLREMFAESGLSLGDVDVRQESFSQQQSDGEESAQSTGFGQTSDDGSLQESPINSTKIVTNNLLDMYA
ncbi:MAG: flagellar hook-length control protein FliK [Woeseiaceae bacterium]